MNKKSPNLRKLLYVGLIVSTSLFLPNCSSLKPLSSKFSKNKTEIIPKDNINSPKYSFAGGKVDSSLFTRLNDSLFDNIAKLTKSYAFNEDNVTNAPLDSTTDFSLDDKNDFKIYNAIRNFKSDSDYIQVTFVNLGSPYNKLMITNVKPDFETNTVISQFSGTKGIPVYFENKKTGETNVSYEIARDINPKLEILLNSLKSESN